MKYDALTIQNAERKAFEMLSRKMHEVHPTSTHPQKIVANEQPDYITSPYTLIQEIPFTAGGPYQFNFTAVNAPPPSAVANNRVLSVNQTVCIYGWSFLIGTGSLAVNRYYRSYGVAVNDDAIYNSTFNMQLETNVLIDGIEGQNFRDTPNSPTESWSTMGMILIQPLRIFNGDLGKLFINIVPNNTLSALSITPNTFLSMRLHCIMGNPNIAK